MTAEEKEIMSPREWRDKYLKENNKIGSTPFGLFDGKSMELYAKYYTQSIIEQAVGEVDQLKNHPINTGLPSKQYEKGLHKGHEQAIREIQTVNRKLGDQE